MKEWAARTMLLGAGIVLSLVAAEIYLRIVSPQPLSLLRVRPDGVLSHVPKLDLELVTAETRARVKTNREGLRDVERPRAKPPGVTRVLVLGDSMIEGFQVELALTMPEQLERRLERALPGRAIEVINAGVSGSSGPQALRYLEKDGPAYAPDLLVVCFFAHDDVQDAAQTADRPRPPAYDFRVFLRSRFHLYTLLERALNANRWLRNAVASLGLVAPPEPAPAEAEIVLTLSEEAYLYDGRASAWEERGHLRLFEAYDGMISLRRSRRIPVLFVLIPSYFQATRVMAVLGDPILARRLVKNDREAQDRVLAFLRSRGVDAIDLLPAAREHPEELFLPVDQHFTARGHAFAAERTARTILEKRLLPAEAAERREKSPKGG